jgi:CHAT domain-containing protein
VVMHRLATGRPAEALAYLDRGRASLAPVGGGGPAAAHPAPRNEVALQYALIGDTLLAWTVGRRLELYRAAVDTAQLVRSIERVRRQLEGAAGETALRAELGPLYEQLIRPVEGRLGAPGAPLVIVADGELASVPFAALYDARRGRYLVEDRPLRFAASLREAWRAAAPGRRAAGDALFVADPAFDAARHLGLARLSDAAGEVREIAAGYPRARLLADAGATPGALRAALGGAGLVHYAGHAVFDDERPERSYLLLAAAPGEPASVLQAAEIAQMDLRHVSLVVLAACQTVRTGPGRAAGFSGLAGAFLAAGAGGAVGSLWDVDDRLTRALMIEFHQAWRASPDGPAALRQAQLRLLRSPDSALRSPAAWAGFRYAGS